MPVIYIFDLETCISTTWYGFLLWSFLIYCSTSPHANGFLHWSMIIEEHPCSFAWLAVFFSLMRMRDLTSWWVTKTIIFQHMSHTPSPLTPQSPLAYAQDKCVLLACFIWLLWSSGEVDLVHSALHCQGLEKLLVWSVRFTPKTWLLWKNFLPTMSLYGLPLIST